MEDILKVHVVKQELDYAQLVKQNAIAAAVTVTIVTVLPGLAAYATKKVAAKLEERRQNKKNNPEN